MRLVRFDSLAPGGAALEVHPRLTLLRGASPELRRRLRAAMRAVVGDGELHEGGVIEVSGVRLALDAATIAQLRLDVQLDPVLAVGDARPTADGAQLAPPVEVVSDDEVALRAQLREVGAARTELARRMDEVRKGLDSFASAALEVCVGQIEALESRRVSLRVDWEQERGGRANELDRASSQLAGLRAVVDRAATLAHGAGPLVSARQAVSDQHVATEPDPSAVQLAARLDAAAARVRDLHDRHDQLRTQLAEAGDELARARAHVDEAERHPPVDRSVVQRLEAVRDEIFAVDDRAGVLGSARHKRRLAELRSEEAILLDRLGFDTYSAYVMGIPSVRAEMERDAQVTDARDRADRLEAQVAVLRAQVADHTAIDDAEHRLHQLLGQALSVVEPDATLPPSATLARDVTTGAGAAELVHRSSAALRRPRVADEQQVRAAQQALSDQVRALAQQVAVPLALPDGPVGLAALPPPPVLPDDGAHRVGAAEAAGERIGQIADRWIAWLEQLQGWIASTESAVVELERLVAELGAPADDERITRWAQVEAELDEALDRLAAAQERVRRHDEATARLAALRTEELTLRDRERELLARISEADAIVPPPAAAPRPPDTDDAAATSAPGDPDALEWWVVSRLARQRAVSFVGSVPALVEGVPADAEARQRLLHRLDRLSDLVQVVVVTDDDTAAAWAAGLGERGARVDL